MNSTSGTKLRSLPAGFAVLGGVGPSAANALSDHIDKCTYKGGKGDYGQFTGVTMNMPIPDRTAYLLDKIETNPDDVMIVNALACNAALRIATFNPDVKVLAGVPCNTFHAPPIFDPFLKLVAEHCPNMEVVHMLEETGKHIKEQFPELARIGLLCTTGTRQTDVYNKILESLGLEVVQVPEEEQDFVHQTIYDKKQGIKEVNPVTDWARDRMQQCVRMLQKQGVNVIIEGCTELPLARVDIEGITYVNPVEILAKAIIRRVEEIYQEAGIDYRTIFEIK